MARPHLVAWLYLQWSHKQPGHISHLSAWLMHVRWWLWTRNVECCTFQRKCYQGSLSVLTSCLSVREQTKIPRLYLPQKVPSFFGITETMFSFPGELYLLGLQLSPAPSSTLTSLSEQSPSSPAAPTPVPLCLLCSSVRGIYLKF